MHGKQQNGGCFEPLDAPRGEAQGAPAFQRVVDEDQKFRIMVLPKLSGTHVRRPIAHGTGR
jgi:hypothetical protein